MSNTEVEVGIEFNQTASLAEIPRAEDVAKTLVDAVNNPNSTFNLSIDAASVAVIRKYTVGLHFLPMPVKAEKYTPCRQ